MNYSLRGKCKEMSEAAVKADPSLTLVSGFYYEPFWDRKEEHWWCKKPDGTIVDPSAGQFPSGGDPSFYTEFTGEFDCSECGKSDHMDKMIHEGRYHFCKDTECYGRFVGVIK